MPPQRGLQTNGGLLITHVEPNSPASDSGLKENMIIVMIGNRQITDAKSLPKELLQIQTGHERAPTGHHHCKRWAR